MTNITALPQRPKVLIIVDYYLPGYKSGGPIRSVSGLVDALEDRFYFNVLTRDHDEGDNHPYPNVIRGAWSKINNTSVFYASQRHLAIWGLSNIITKLRPDIIYLNSFFSILSIKLLVLRRIGVIKNTPIIMAPRGEFSPGAIRIKSYKKRPYIMVSNAVGLYDNLIWQASTDMERKDIERVFVDRPNISSDKIFVAPDIPSAKIIGYDCKNDVKVKNTARFIFISRITQKKNLLGAIQYLACARGDVTLDIYGPIEERSYWEKCQKAIGNLPHNITVNYKSSLPYNQVADIFRSYHFFLFPTMGENFGHVIFESFASGCPVVVSDQTPWQDLRDRGVGWDIPLEATDRWQATIQACIDMDSETYNTMSARAKELAADWINSSTLLKQNLSLFNHAWNTRNLIYDNNNLMRS
jgi:glycosyltransferase involved in cell wall biosynthesis